MTVGDVAGLGLGVLGFALAIWQIWLVKKQVNHALTVAEATQAAIGNTERLNAVIELMRVIPQLQALEQDVASAVRGEDKDMITSNLQRWRATAAETRGLIQEQNFESMTLEARLQESSQNASQAIDRLEESEDPVSATKSVLTTIAAATEDAAVLMGRLKTQPGVQMTGDGA